MSKGRSWFDKLTTNGDKLTTNGIGLTTMDMWHSLFSFFVVPIAIGMVDCDPGKSGSSQ